MYLAASHYLNSICFFVFLCQYSSRISNRKRPRIRQIFEDVYNQKETLPSHSRCPKHAFLDAINANVPSTRKEMQNVLKTP